MSSSRKGNAAARRSDEAAARQLLAPLISGELVHAEPPAPDLEIRREGRVVGGVEVTRHTLESFLSLSSALGKRGTHVESKELAATWQVGLDWTAAHLRDLDDRRLVEMVVGFERDGATHLTGDSLPTDARQAGVRSAFRLRGNPSRPHRIYLAPESTGGFAQPSAVYEAVAAAVRRKRRQLHRIDGDRHLFVWIDPVMIGAAIALEDPPPPIPVPPPLPAGLDHAWVAPSAFGQKSRIWRRASSDRAWTAVVLPNG